MIGGFLLFIAVSAWVMHRRHRARNLAGLNDAAPIHSVMVGPRTRRLSPLKGERL